MNKHIIISVLGKDQTGIVAAIAKTLYETGCNLEDSSMTQLRGEFAMIVMATLPEPLSPKAVEERFGTAAERLGLTITVRELTDAEEKGEKAEGEKYVISVYGADKAGIVYSISQYLADHRINITDVQTRVSENKGKALYIMFLEVSLPQGAATAAVKGELDLLAKDLNVTVTMNPVDEMQL